ncbi:MAG: Eco47II family restriction endonuclease [Bifidobacteriaceae bacterium]|nr:Eco47II family restriction endonuclease [Bifidobacteriaceae bacterium]
MQKLKFISNEHFKEHVQATISNYGEKLIPYDLEKFNSNTIDPIKLIFDKTVYRYSWEEIIKNEIFRQRDKSNNNSIGYFHQRIFQYIDNCTVPQEGWDVIVQKDEKITLPEGDNVKTIYVEMKNKHNTMNSAASGKTYIKMQHQLLSDDDCACFLVETIAKHSQNITWNIKVDGESKSHKRIRRVSMDEFYSIVTGESDAFYRMCMALPAVIEEVISDSAALAVPNDTVIDELQEIAKREGNSFALALYMLGFKTYMGFASA